MVLAVPRILFKNGLWSQKLKIEILKTEYVETPERITTAMNKTTIHDMQNVQIVVVSNLETMNISAGTIENEQSRGFKMNNKAKVNVIKFLLQFSVAEMLGYSELRNGVLAVTSASVERSFLA